MPLTIHRSRDPIAPEIGITSYNSPTHYIRISIASHDSLPLRPCDIGDWHCHLQFTYLLRWDWRYISRFTTLEALLHWRLTSPLPTYPSPIFEIHITSPHSPSLIPQPTQDHHYLPPPIILEALIHSRNQRYLSQFPYLTSPPPLHQAHYLTTSLANNHLKT